MDNLLVIAQLVERGIVVVSANNNSPQVTGSIPVHEITFVISRIYLKIEIYSPYT